MWIAINTPDLPRPPEQCTTIGDMVLPIHEPTLCIMYDRGTLVDGMD